jgi:hypothetical protein
MTAGDGVTNLVWRVRAEEMTLDELDKIADRLARNVHPNKDEVEELIALARERFERKPSPPYWESAEALRDEIKRCIDRIERRLELSDKVRNTDQFAPPSGMTADQWVEAKRRIREEISQERPAYWNKVRWTLIGVAYLVGFSILVARSQIHAFWVVIAAIGTCIAYGVFVLCVKLYDERPKLLGAVLLALLVVGSYMLTKLPPKNEPELPIATSPAIPDFMTDEERKACKQSQFHEPWECDPIVEPNK